MHGFKVGYLKGRKRMIFEVNERVEMDDFEPKDITVSMDL